VDPVRSIATTKQLLSGRPPSIASTTGSYPPYSPVIMYAPVPDMGEYLFGEDFGQKPTSTRQQLVRGRFHNLLDHPGGLLLGTGHGVPKCRS